jgi:hypothetical protein
MVGRAPDWAAPSLWKERGPTRRLTADPGNKRTQIDGSAMTRFQFAHGRGKSDGCPLTLCQRLFLAQCSNPFFLSVLCIICGKLGVMSLSGDSHASAVLQAAQAPEDWRTSNTWRRARP